MALPDFTMETLEKHLLANLIDYFRYRKNHEKYSYAAKIAANQFARRESSFDSRLEETFLAYSNHLKGNINPLSLLNFSKVCVRSWAKARGPFIKPELERPSIRKVAIKTLQSSLLQGLSPTSAINKAAFQMVKEVDERQKHRIQLEQAKHHPLGRTLEAITPNLSRLPKEDIRKHFLNLKKYKDREVQRGEGILFGLLQMAQSFSCQNLLELLGADLFFLIRPLGFLDKTRSIVVCEVENESLMYTLTYKKMVIINALKRDDAFSLVKNIRFKVAQIQ